MKDDLLIICGSFSGPRPPERFTSSKDPQVALTILRRGKIWPRGVSEGRALRLPD